MIAPIFVFELKRIAAEVDQQPVINLRCGKVIHQLSLMTRNEGRNRFQLQDQAIFHNDVGDIIPDTNTFVVNPNRDFLFSVNPGTLQLKDQGVFVDFFQISRTEMAMDFHRQPDYGMRQPTQFHLIHHSFNSLDRIDRIHTISSLCHRLVP